MLDNGVSNHLDYTATFFLKGLKFLHIFIPWQLRQRMSAAKRSYPTPKVRGGNQEERPCIRGKEQWLCFAGVAVKRYPTSKVTETQVRW